MSSGHLLPTIAGVVRYEMRSARRRRSVLLAVLPTSGLALLLAFSSPSVNHWADPVTRVAAATTLVNVLGSLGVAVALADGAAGTHGTGVEELLAATPSSPLARRIGGLLGPWQIALLPCVLTLVLFGARQSIAGASALPFLAALLGVVTVVVPGALALTSLAQLLAALVPVTVARVAVVPVWYWATLLNPVLLPVPTLARTVLSPLGAYPAVVWLRGPRTWTPHQGRSWLTPPADDLSALASVLVTVAAAAVMLLAARAAASLRHAATPAPRGR